MGSTSFSSLLSPHHHHHHHHHHQELRESVGAAVLAVAGVVMQWLVTGSAAEGATRRAPCHSGGLNAAPKCPELAEMVEYLQGATEIILSMVNPGGPVNLAKLVKATNAVQLAMAFDSSHRLPLRQAHDRGVRLTITALHVSEGVSE
jgi:hypothetical protein